MLARTLGAFAARRLGKGGIVKALAQSAALTVLISVVAHMVMIQVTLSAEMYCGINNERHYSYNYGLDDVICDRAAWTNGAVGDVLAMGALVLGLLIIAPLMVSAQLGAEKKAGTLEQLRGTPISAMSLLIAQILAGPAQVYLLLTGPLLYHVAYGASGGMPLAVLFGSLAPLFFGSFALSLVAAALALGTKRGAGILPGFIVGALVACTGFIALAIVDNAESYASFWAYLHPVGAAQAALLSFDGPWRHLFVRYYRLPTFGVSNLGATFEMLPVAGMMFWSVAGALLLPAIARRLASPELPLLGKRTALALFALCAVGAVVPALSLGEFDLADHAARYTLVYGFFLLPIMALLIIAATPSRELWSMGLGRVTGIFADARGPRALGLAMLSVFALVVLATQHGIFSGSTSYEGKAAAWGLYLAFTLPTLWQFHATRAQRSGAYLFFVGTFVFLQIVGIVLIAFGDGTRPDTHPLAAFVARFAAFIGVVAPLVVAWHQRRHAMLALGTPELPR